MSLILMILTLVLSIEVPQDGHSFVMQASPDGHMMVRLHGLSPREDARTYIYDTHTGEILFDFPLSVDFEWVDGGFIIWAVDNDPMLIDSATGEVLLTFPGERFFKWSNGLLLSQKDDEVIIRDGESMTILPVSGRIVDWNGRWISVKTTDNIQIYDAGSGDLMLEVAAGVLGCGVQSAPVIWLDGEHPLVNGHIWNIYTGDLIYTLGQSFSYLDASHGRIAIIDNDALMILDAWTGEQLQSYENSYYVGVKWSPDGRYLAAWSAAEYVHVYDIESGEIVLEAPHYSSVEVCATLQMPPEWTVDNRLITWMDGRRSSFLFPGQVVEILGAEEYPIFDAPNGTQIATLSHDGIQAIILSEDVSHNGWIIALPDGRTGWISQYAPVMLTAVRTPLHERMIYVWDLTASTSSNNRSKKIG